MHAAQLACRPFRRALAKRKARSSHVTLRLPTQLSESLTKIAGRGDIGPFIRSSVAALLIRGRIMHPVPNLGKCSTETRSVRLPPATLELWQEVARHLTARGSVNQLVAAGLYQTMRPQIPVETR